jgi:hypothetical protein
VLRHLRQSGVERAPSRGRKITSSNVRRGTIDSTARRPLVPNRRMNGIGTTPPPYRLSRAVSNRTAPWALPGLRRKPTQQTRDSAAYRGETG